MTIALTDKAARDVSASGYPTVFPAGSIIDIFDAVQVPGAVPAGNKIATGILPATPWGTQAGRSVPKQGTWQVTGTALAGAGTDALGWRLKTAADTGAATQAEARIAGTCGEAGSGADAIFDNSNIANGQVATINTLTLGIA